ncbi:MAG TPA: hypothetical protein VMV29_23470 [Ktedonobacterales bacterium]|nr:hypothetical protein [Ktedonobacterales bacterium]
MQTQNSTPNATDRNPIYADAYIRTFPDGEDYAITYRRDDGEITSACGPLDGREVTRANLVIGFHNDPELVDWLMSDAFGGNDQPTMSYSLLSDEQVRAMEEQYNPTPITGTLAHVLETEDAAMLETHGYVVNVCDDRGHEDDPRFELNVCVGGMPPHARHYFGYLSEVEAYIAAGEVLDVTADDTRWQSVTE